jgi:O-antigen ligase
MFTELQGFVPKSFQSTYQNTSTLQARQGFWAAAWGEFQDRNIIDQLFGYYAGRATLLVTETGGLWQTSLHNQFIQTAYNFGIAGAAAFFLLIATGVISALNALRRKRNANSAGLPPAVAVSWLTAMIVYGYAYEWSLITSIFAVLACAPWGTRPAAVKIRLPSTWGRTGSAPIAE